MSTFEIAGKTVGRMGFGIMQMTWTHNPPSDEVAFKAMKAAADAGATLWSSATFYGYDNPMASIDLLARFFNKYPEYKEKIVIAVKGGVGEHLQPNWDYDFLKADVAAVKSKLGDKVLDIYLPARILADVDPVTIFTPYQRLVSEGLITAFGASECSAKTLKAITAAGLKPVLNEIEVSLWSYEQDIKDALAWSTETQTPTLCYSPLGRGFLTRKWTKPEDIPKDLFQAQIPRFQGEAFYENLKLVDKLEEIAEKKGITASQLALAWVCDLSPYNVPIPGSSDPKRVESNTAAVNIKLTAEEKAEINKFLESFEAAGDRYPGYAAPMLMV